MNEDHLGKVWLIEWSNSFDKLCLKGDFHLGQPRFDPQHRKYFIVKKLAIAILQLGLDDSHWRFIGKKLYSAIRRSNGTLI